MSHHPFIVKKLPLEGFLLNLFPFTLNYLMSSSPWWKTSSTRAFKGGLLGIYPIYSSSFFKLNLMSLLNCQITSAWDSAPSTPPGSHSLLAHLFLSRDLYRIRKKLKPAVLLREKGWLVRMNPHPTTESELLPYEASICIGDSTGSAQCPSKTAFHRALNAIISQLR